MPGDLIDVIQGAVDTARSEGVFGDEGGGSESSEVIETAGTEAPVETVVDEKPVVETPAGDTKVETKVETKVDDKSKKDEPSEVAKLMEEAGIKAPETGKDNRIPYSRVTKIIENALTKAKTTHQTELTERDTKIKAHENELAGYQRADKLIETDPDRYIGMLAAIHPDKYGKFVKGATVAPVAGAKETAEPVDLVAAVGPEPPADIKYNDGSEGYSPEQWKKHNQWVEDRATARAQMAFNERLSPIEKKAKEADAQAKAAVAHNTRLANVQKQVAAAKELWGEDFTSDYDKAAEGDGSKSEILVYMRAHPEVPFDRCVAAVLLPKRQANRDKMREDLLKEIDKKAAKVSGTVVATRTTNDETAEPDPNDLEAVIRGAVSEARASGRIRG
jgi:hypothetical protein